MRSTCENVNKIYKFYIQNYEKCEKNHQLAFCEELNDFKEAYNSKKGKFTPVKTLLHSCLQRKKINEINKIEKEKTECLENILEEVNGDCEGSLHNIGYQSKRDT
ncbi:uncharacterized protein MKS88_000144 [Plasmodium brasilianum]|uniref:Uncharacterized protein n=1 Tax=Plasmodium brasilianum TaxID=5824 RepID=A0ACB9YDU7_PLABR|nr:hypothetical protein MKS88_001267 [Plasmodium brasilianum]KAI4841423.1 hypothetical protein MKS88_000144 [Plasmodium brasilianum]